MPRARSEGAPDGPPAVAPERRGPSGTIAPDAPAAGTPFVNSFFVMMGIESWKPIVSALVMPPVPFLLLILIGARLILPRRGLGWLVLLIGVAGIWLGACAGFARGLESLLLREPPALSIDRIAELRGAAKAHADTVIVVLGGGLEPYAPEYGVTNLTGNSLERLRYGLWLGRETGLPVMFSGGVGWGARGFDGSTEAEVASRVATREFGRPLKLIETQSRDTNENAVRTLPLLQRNGYSRVVLVTHGWHMPRARRAFERAAAATGQALTLVTAPMGLSGRGESAGTDWLPTSHGYRLMQNVLHEWVGGLAGA